MAGMRYLTSKKALIFLSLFGAGVNFFLSPMNAFLLPYVTEMLSLGMWVVSLMQIIITLLSALGSFAAPKLRKRINFRLSAALSGISVGLMYAVCGILPRLGLGELGNIIVLCVVSAIAMLPVGLVQVNFSSIFYENLDENYVARVSGTFGAINILANPIGSFLCAALVSFVPITTLFIFCAPLVLLFFASSYIPKAIKEVDK
jgi:MFS family permease